jgi:hypothetical protein
MPTLPTAVKIKLIVLWTVTGILLALNALGVIDWSPWIIAAPVLALIGVIVILACIPISIGLYNGLKIRLVHGRHVR